MVLRDNLTIVVALGVSIGLHVLIVPIVYAKKPPMVHVLPAKSSHLKTPAEKARVELGIDKSEASTLTWIGYEDYEQQRARFAEIEQAEMLVETEAAKANPIETTLSTLLLLTKPAANLASNIIEALQGIELTTPAKELPVVQPVDIKPQVSKPSNLIEDSPIETNPSDRDSEATSIIHISPDQWKAGKPLAAQGIVLRPRRPSFTANQLVANAPGNLVAELQIDNSGKPQTVIILLSTGSHSIDRSIESSLYRWRASGDEIDELEGNKTFKIIIHITFSR